jgi:ABC-type transporter Mla subunit MlaD
VAHAWAESSAHGASIEEIGGLQLATIPPRVHCIKHLARLSNDLAGLSNDLAGLSNDLAGLSKGLAELSNDLAELSKGLAELSKGLAELSKGLAWPANDSINGVFDEKSKKLAFLAAGHANNMAEIGGTLLHQWRGLFC